MFPANTDVKVGLCKVRKERVIRLGAGRRTEKPGTPPGAELDPVTVLHCPFSL